MQPLAEQIAGFDRGNAEILLIFQSQRIGSGVQQHTDASAVDFSEGVCPDCPDHQRHQCRAAEQIPERKPRRKQHEDRHGCKNDRGTVVTLHSDDACRNCGMHQQQEQVQRLIQLFRDLGDMQGKGDEKDQLQDLRRLHLNEAEVDPVDVVRALSAVSEARECQSDQTQRDRYI